MRAGASTADREPIRYARFDAFLCSSDADETFARELYDRLTRDGVRCFFAKEDVDWGQNFVAALEVALPESRHVIVLLSPELVGSEWAAIERAAATVDDPAALRRRILPIVVRPCRAPPFLRAIQALDCTSRAKLEREYPRICRSLGGRPHVETPRSRRGVLPPVPERLPERFDVPFHSLRHRFVGRERALWDVHEALVGPLQGGEAGGLFAVALQGLPGVGKSQVAIEYAYRFSPSYPGGVYWVCAERAVRLGAIRRIAEFARIRLPVDASEDQEVNALWTELARLPPSLVVLDNYSDHGAGTTSGQEGLRAWLPPAGNVRVLVTTRWRDESGITTPIDVDVLREDDAVALLVQGREPTTPSEQKAARHIARRLGCLPLALEVARSFFKHRTGAYAEVLGSIARRGTLPSLEMMARAYAGTLPTGRGTAVLALFAESWERCSELGRTLLQVMAHLASEPVPIDLLREIAWSITGQGRRDALDDPIDAALLDLERSSFVRRGPAGDPVVHRLLGELVRRQLDEPRRTGIVAACERAVHRRMRRAFDERDVASVRDLVGVVPHAEALTEGAVHARRWRVVDDLADALSCHFLERGLFPAAERWARASLRAVTALEGAEGGAMTARATTNLAVVLTELDRGTDAKPLLDRALEIAERTWGPDDPRVAVHLSNLAQVLQDLNRAAEARPLLQRALAIGERAFGPDDPSVAVRLSNLAMVYCDLGRVAEAKPLLERALAIHERAYGPDHPNVASCLRNLTVVLHALGRLDQARALLERTLAIHQRTLGTSHPHVASDLGCLASVLHDLGHPAHAKPLLERALAIHERTLGADHPDVAVARAKLASVLLALGHAVEAIPHAESAAAILAARHGDDHPYARGALRLLERARAQARIDP